MSIFITLGAAVKAFSIEELSCKNAAVSVSLYLYRDCKILDLKREPWCFLFFTIQNPEDSCVQIMKICIL